VLRGGSSGNEWSSGKAGNIFVDGKPVCDDDFGNDEAKVVCRCVISHIFVN
jgi:hypothetical protein